jgi:hypothetical protein
MFHFCLPDKIGKFRKDQAVRLAPAHFVADFDPVLGLLLRDLRSLPGPKPALRALLHAL